MINAILLVILSAALTSWGLGKAGQEQNILSWFLVLMSIYLVVWAGLAGAGAKWGKTTFRETGRLFSYGFLSSILLFLIPVAVRMPLPMPHNFALRKIQLVFGLAYLVFGVIQFVIFLRLVNRNGQWQKLEMKKLKVLLWSTAFVFYCFVGLWMSYCNQPTGDEPHYLLMAHSLVYDHDLDLKNNYENKDYQEFYQGEIEPQDEGQATGTHYSHHSPGLAFLLALPYLMYGVWGARVLMLGIAAFFSLNLFLLVWEVYKRRQEAFLTWLICLTSAPLVLYSNHLATEMTSGCIVTYLFRKCLDEKKSFSPILLGLGLGALCWLHEMNYLMSLLLFSVLVWKKPGRPYLAWTLLSYTVMVGLISWLNYRHFGSILAGHNLENFVISGNPLYVPAAASPFLVALKSMFRAGMGQFLDQECGLFFYAPVFIFVGAGWFYLKKFNKELAFTLALMLLSYLLVISSFGGWRGGGPGPRYLVPLHLIFTLCLAGVLIWLKKSKFWKWLWLLVGIGWLEAFVFAWIPWMRFSRGNGINWIFVILERPLHLPLHLLFPSLWVGGMRSYVLSLLYGFLIVWGTWKVYRELGGKGRV